MTMIGLPICVCLLLLLSVISVANGLEDFPASPNFLSVQPNSTVKFPFPAVSTYRRTVMNSKTSTGIDYHVFRICSGNSKNKAKCGFWENVKTKKKVASGATSYNKMEKVLVIKKFRLSDSGTYTAGNDKDLSYQTVIFDFGR